MHCQHLKLISTAVLAKLQMPPVGHAEAGMTREMSLGVWDDLEQLYAKQARLDHATAVGEQQRVVEEEERAKMAALAEQMSNESAQREGEVRRRHEAAMAKLAVQRERQVAPSSLRHPVQLTPASCCMSMVKLP